MTAVADKALKGGELVSSHSGALAVRQLHAGYASIAVLKDVSFDLPSGRVLALVGPNGAGKTTLVKTIAGLLRPQSGAIEFDGRSIAKTPTHLIAASGLILVPETRDIFRELTVWENLKVAFDNLASGDDEPSAFDRIYSLFPILRERQDQRAGNLSGGQQQMLAIARALLGRPKILMLDEPSLGLAGIIIREIYSKLQALREEGLTILLVEQNANLAIGFADRTAVLVNGRIVLEGSSDELRSNADLVRHYLGGA